MDLAGDARPRCTLELPQATEPGIFNGSCACGLTFAVTVRGGPGDTSRVVFRCWNRSEPPAAPPLRSQPNLFR